MKSLPPASRQKIWRTVVAAVTLAAVAAIGWLAIQATGRRESVEEAREARQHALQVAALAANREIIKEINLRFGILRQLATDDDLRQQMNQIDRSPNDERLWNRLEEWLGARRSDHDREAPADSWFINDARGIQVARSPRSDASRGKNYAYRDYFHGRGADLPETTRNLKPLRDAHQSVVYRSTSTNRLKVAFSVPIENKRSGDDRRVVGVLSMSVDLGAFNSLKKEELPPDYEVVLIDRRETTIDGHTGRGLILHRQIETSQSQQQAPWIGDELLVRIEKLLTSQESRERGAMLLDYRDNALTGGKLFWGALKPVIIRRTDEPERDTQWVVLVQEPVSR
jgi:hypothetical protein